MTTDLGVGAVRALLRMVPDFMPCPEVKLEDDGMIGFDWDHSKDCVLSMHVDDNGHAGWAALIGDYRSHGAFALPDWPADLVDAFKRFEAASS